MTISKIEKWTYPLNQIFQYLYPIMIRVKFTDNGEEITVNNYEELLKYMRSQSYGQESSNEEYMKNYAIRAVNLKNEDIRATGLKEFFEDLKKYKHIIVL